MPGTGHSGRYKGSISNRNTKPAFQVLAPWNSTKNGEKGEVAVSTGGTNLKFAKLDAQQMANYDGNTFNMNNNLTVAGTNTVTGNTSIGGNLTATGTTTVENLFVNQTATYNSHLIVEGDFTVNGTTTTVNTSTTELEDSIIKFSSAESDEQGHKSNGLLFCYNKDPGSGIILEETGFFGVQRKVPPSFDIADDNIAIGSEPYGTNGGVFTYWRKNINNDPTGVLRDTNLSFDIPFDSLGGALFMDLELHGNLVGHDTFTIQNTDLHGQIVINSTGNSNDAISIASSNGGIDIDGGPLGDIDIKSNGASVNITSTKSVSNAIVLSASAGGIDITSQGASPHGDIDVTSSRSLNLIATNAIKIAASNSGIDIDGGPLGDIDIKSNGASVNINSTEAHASAIVLIASAGGIDIESKDQHIDIKSNNANVNITSTASAANAIKIAAAGGIDIDGGLGGDIDIKSTGKSVNITSTETDASAIVLSASTGGINIDAGAASNFTTSSGALTLDGASGVNITGNASEVDITTTGNVDINAAATTIDSSAGVSIDAAAASNFTTSSGALTLDGASGVNITGNASEVDITTTGDVDINAAATTIDASDKITITSAANVADAITVEATAGGVYVDAAAGNKVNIAGGQVALVSKDDAASAISLTTNNGTSETILVANNKGTNNKAINICAEDGGIALNSKKTILIGTDSSKTGNGISIGHTNTSGGTTFNGHATFNKTITATAAPATFDTVVTNHLNLLNNFTIGTIGSGQNNYILFGPGATIGNGVINDAGGALNIPTTNLLKSVNIRESVTWISNDGAGTYAGTAGTDVAVLKGGSLIVDGNMLFGAARGRTGAYDQGPEVNVTYPGDGNQHRLLDMNCNDISGIRILSFGKKPIGPY
jgi:hypothetical protein